MIVNTLGEMYEFTLGPTTFQRSLPCGFPMVYFSRLTVPPPPESMCPWLELDNKAFFHNILQKLVCRDIGFIIVDYLDSTMFESARDKQFLILRPTDSTVGHVLLLRIQYTSDRFSTYIVFPDSLSADYPLSLEAALTECGKVNMMRLPLTT